MSLCKECVSGVTHDGTATGKLEEINGVNTYVAIPSVEYPKDKAILFLCDVFGLGLVNNKLLADDFAKNGFQTYVPDYFNGDPIPEDAMSNPNRNFDRNEWRAKHGKEVTRPLLDKAIAGLRERGVTTFAAVGYCFGARYVFDLAFVSEIKVAAVAHPSMLEVPGDLEQFKKTSVPLLICSCETDPQYSQEKQATGDEILGGGKMEADAYKRVYYPGCTHGFAVRGDMSKPEVRAGKEGAFKETAQWFLKYL